MLEGNVHKHRQNFIFFTHTKNAQNSMEQKETNLQWENKKVNKSETDRFSAFYCSPGILKPFSSSCCAINFPNIWLNHCFILALPITVNRELFINQIRTGFSIKTTSNCFKALTQDNF